MNIKTVSECLSLDTGTPIPAMQGHIKSVFPRKTGEGTYGPYSFENLILEDEQGQTIRVTLKSCPPLAYEKGDHIVIQSRESEKGWSGVERKDERYQDKLSKNLIVTRAARMMLASEMVNGSVTEPKPSLSKSVPSAAGDSEAEYIKRLCQSGNAYLRAYVAMQSVAIAAKSAGLPPMTEAQIQAGTFTIYKDAVRPTTAAAMPTDIGVSSMPDGDGYGEEDFKPAEPENVWPE